MCAVSNVGDYYSNPGAWPQWPGVIPFPKPAAPPMDFTGMYDLVPRGEVEKLREQVKQMKKELAEAKQQDIAEGNEDCEMELKVSILKQIAQGFGVSLKEIFPE